MASNSLSPSVIIGCEYGSQKSFWSKKLSSSFTSKLVRNNHFPQFLHNNLNFPRKSPRKLRLRAASVAHESNRPLMDFAPSPWTDHFLSVRVEDSEIEGLSNEIEALKPRVRDMLMSSRSNVMEITRLIYLLDTFCLSYHFEDDIEAILQHAFDNIEDKIADENDLYSVSVAFRVFRRHGHRIPCDVFERFRGDDGKFKRCLVRDIKGMLSLYEAAYLGTTAEDVMDEAMSFTANHLESLARKASPHLSKLIQNALYRPQHHNADLLVARGYISFYEREEDHDETLLKFAKLNFNYLQLHYVRELNILTKWWKDLNLASKLPYIRDRMAELYFWTTILYFEPQFSRGRITAAKSFTLWTLVDDTCDAYGTLSEVETLVGNLERLDPDVIDTVPGYLKIVLRFVLDVFEELEQQVRPEGKSYYVQYIEEQFRRLIGSYLKISKWARNGNVPTFEEYMENGIVSGTTILAIAPCLMSMGQIAGREVHEWLESYPKLIEALDVIARLVNDITTFKDEMSRGEIATGINCYMKQYGVTEEEASAEFRKRIQEAEKAVNEEFLSTTVVPRKILQVAVNCGRLLDITYKYADEFTHPEGKYKESITTLFVEPIPL